MRPTLPTAARISFGLLALLAGGGCGATINDYLLLARKGDQEEVREAVLGVGNLLVEKESEGYAFSAGDREAIEFLQAAAVDHPDTVCRMRAVSALRRLRTVDSSEVWKGAASDPHWGVRLEAAKAFSERPEAVSSELIAQRLEVETRREIRVGLVRALTRQRDRTALRVLLEVILDETGRYDDNKLKAYEGVTSISGKDWPYEATVSWRKYYQSEFPRSGDGGETSSPLDPDRFEGDRPR